MGALNALEDHYYQKLLKDVITLPESVLAAISVTCDIQNVVCGNCVQLMHDCKRMIDLLQFSYMLNSQPLSFSAFLSLFRT